MSADIAAAGDRSGSSTRTPDAHSTHPRGSPDRTTPRAVSKPNLVTRIDNIPLNKAPVEKRLPHLANLRSMADLGWSEAALVLAPIVARCISDPPRTEREILEANNPATMIRLGDARQWAEMSPEERAAERERWSRSAERMIEQDRFRPEQCRLAQPEDPDHLMTWLEQALIQQPPGFFAAMLDDPRMVPTETGWMVRNAEHLARFNLGFLNALRARVMAGDPEVVGRAWKAFAGRQFMPEPDPVQAWAHGLVARRLPEPWSEPAPTDADYQRLVEAGLGPKDIGLAQEISETLWRRCCATSMPR